MIDRRLITYFNWPLLGITLLLTFFGLANLRSATLNLEVQSSWYFQNQILWSVLGLATLALTTTIHYRFYQGMSYWIYGITLLFLVLVLVLGREISGHQSWLEIGPLRLQPSELAKIGFLFAMAKHLSESRFYQAGVKELVPSLFLFLLPTLLVLLQGDLGSSLFFGLIYISLILTRGVQGRLVAWMAIVVVMISLLGYLFLLSPYQKNRIKTFVNPELDRRGAGYHLIQSKIAVGSGSFLGKGYGKGQTHKLKFIPERHTDFIFPVLAEEWGFFGSCVVLGLYLVFLLLLLEVAKRSSDLFSFFMAVGVTALFFWHLVINLGGVLGLMPLTGVPLPFFSYGGSSLLTNWIGLGILLNISMRRFMFR